MIASYLQTGITSMKTDDLLIPEYNWLPHQDIDMEMLKKQDGLFSCTIKVAAGRIVDFVVMETITSIKFDHER